MLIKELLDNQKVIFCGPLFNESDEFLKNYDTVIRTNNFFSIDKNILKSERCDILITNRLYYKFNHNIIIENLDKIKCLILFDDDCYLDLLKRFPKEELGKVVKAVGPDDYIRYKGKPFLLIKFVGFLTKFFKPNEFFIDGLDFYDSKDISKFWLPGYAIKQSMKCNVLERDKDNHHIPSNKKYLKEKIKKYGWIKVGEMVRKSLSS